MIGNGLYSDGATKLVYLLLALADRLDEDQASATRQTGRQIFHCLDLHIQRCQVDQAPASENLWKGPDILNPLLAKSGHTRLGKVVIGTVEGDIHDIGKRIVSSLLEGNGFEVTDLGVDVKADTFIKAVEEIKPDFLGMSALLTTTMPHMEEVIDLLKDKKLREKMKIIVGGASVNDQFAKAIGADSYAPEAGSAVEWMIKSLTK